MSGYNVESANLQYSLLPPQPTKPNHHYLSSMNNQQDSATDNQPNEQYFGNSGYYYNEQRPSTDAANNHQQPAPSLGNTPSTANNASSNSNQNLFSYSNMYYQGPAETPSQYSASSHPSTASMPNNATGTATPFSSYTYPTRSFSSVHPGSTTGHQLVYSGMQGYPPDQQPPSHPGQPPMKRYSVSYPMGANLQGTFPSSSMNYAEPSQQYGQLSYAFNQAPKQINMSPTQYKDQASVADPTTTATAGTTPGTNATTSTPYYSFNSNYYYNQPYGQIGGSANNNLVMKNEDFLNDLSPTVVGFGHPHTPISSSHKAKNEDAVDPHPIPLNLGNSSQPSNYNSQQQYSQSITEYGSNKDIFQAFKNRLDGLKHVKLIRTNTLPKEEISKNITVIENNNKKVYFNFEYPTVSITFQEPINNVTFDWSEAEKSGEKRRLVLFYWDFCLVKANHVINNGVSRDASPPLPMPQAHTTEFFNENLEYIKSILHLKHEIITQEEYQILFEDHPATSISDYRLKQLTSIIKDPVTNTMKSTFGIISCLYWNHTDNFYLTSVDLLFLLDKLSGRTSSIANNVSIADIVVVNGCGDAKRSTGSGAPGRLVGATLVSKKGKFASKSQVKKLKQAAKFLKAIDGKEINRIRRNLLNFKSITLGKQEAEYEDDLRRRHQQYQQLQGNHQVASTSQGASNFGTEEEMMFFHKIMSFSNPKPRKIEKKLKVYEWRVLEQALDKIMKKYCVDLKNGSSGISDDLRESGLY
ncbi:hypothetical protein DASC09_063800 [Saccharomycopsis crataegensis]|uniref:DUF7082 domain-containing protein n=1 Tax=Saccharomycopsis crataegensis TaxID=43959 RepID=A0AAV5QWD6_9ASCO|nr:hypothetical protein DASC09_063800 [Saccharomycopsis crataegensis]